MFLPCFRIKITSKHINNVSLSIEVMNYGDTQSNKINLTVRKCPRTSYMYQMYLVEIIS